MDKTENARNQIGIIGILLEPDKLNIQRGQTFGSFSQKIAKQIIHASILANENLVNENEAGLT